jgi:sirohydrochlorin ferrochelatase
MNGARHGRGEQGDAVSISFTAPGWNRQFHTAMENKLMKTAILLIAHGSREADANADLHHVADCLRRRGEAIVVASFLELAAPDIAEGGRMCVQAGVEQVVLMPYFLSAGVHVRRDLTQAREELAKAFPQVAFVLAEPLGRHPLLVEVVAERVREAVEGEEPVK